MEHNDVNAVFFIIQCTYSNDDFSTLPGYILLLDFGESWMFSQALHG